MNKFKVLFFVLPLFFILVLFPSSSFALGKPDVVGQGKRDQMQLLKQKNGTPEAETEDEIESSNPGKIRSCDARLKNLKKRASSLVRLTENMQDKFSKIEEKVTNFYTTKVLTSGTTVANYATLKTEITTKKSAIQTALTAAQNTVDTFSCATGDIKIEVTKFRDDMLDVKLALKEYRTSVKNLIVAVHSANRNNKVTPTI